LKSALQATCIAGKTASGGKSVSALIQQLPAAPS
jgi:hypothetical protein